MYSYHPTGGVLEADLSPHGSTRSAGDTGISVTDALELAGDRSLWRANRNGGMLRLIASRHDDDDDDEGWKAELTKVTGLRFTRPYSHPSK